MKKILILLLILSSTALLAQVNNKKGETKTETYNNDFPAYVIYNDQGERVTYLQMVNSVVAADI
ncbi:MAG TPA: hypothetical protein DF637_01140, partial [Rikenellaceae bacterium]|nr:hypothetical protein [Rikenellaceae bacterium]